MSSVGKSGRPTGYQYLTILKDYLGGDLSRVFNGELIYPRQLEVHLPGDHKRVCNFNCYYCQGRLLERPLGEWEDKAISIIDQLQGRMPFFIYGGAYTEPLLNPRLIEFLELTKKYGSYFGIHTNGSMLLTLEKEQSFLTRLCSIAGSPQDYLSISLDAGTTESHCKLKGVKKDWFSEIIEALRVAVRIRGTRSHPSLRVCYLLNKFSDSLEEIKTIIHIMKDIGPDSLRFSIPYDNYGRDFEVVKRYKREVELPRHEYHMATLGPLMSTSSDERPFIFYLSPFHQDVERMQFAQCIYGYYQITFAADGFVYKCSSAASPSFKKVRLGRIPNSLEKFNQMVLANYDPGFRPSKCFAMGARCNRIALEINSEWHTICTGG